MIFSEDKLIELIHAVVYLTQKDKKFLVDYGYENAVECARIIKNIPRFSDGKPFYDHTVRQFYEAGYMNAARWKLLPYSKTNPNYHTLGQKPPKGYLKKLKFL